MVFHVIHQNGNENLSDTEVKNAFELLNEGFANRGSFDRGSGVDTKIQFCLARIDPEGNYTTGINHVYADVPKVIPKIHDQFLKSLINWDPSRYINIWIVKEVQLLEEVNECGEEDEYPVGYATMPDAHGSAVDGIVVEANAVPGGSTLIHEMGHYLGLFHTFEGGCANNDCSIDGDAVCDTPPQIKRRAKCDGSSNSCSTDTLSGFSTDQNDIPYNHMDYSGCRHDFTQGQKVRMRFMISNVRNSLLVQNICSVQCLQATDAIFSFPIIDYKAGDSIRFTSMFAAAGYEWRINNQVKSAAASFDFVFDHQGWFKVELLTTSAAGMSCNNRKLAWIKVYCAVKPRIAVNKIKVQVREDVLFSNTTTTIRRGADSVLYSWYYNDTVFSNEVFPAYQFTAPGDKIIYLITQKGSCVDTSNYELVIVKPLPDYKLKLIDLQCDGENKKKLVFSVCNDGFFDAPAGLPISFYYRNPTTGNAQPITDVYFTTSAIGKFCCKKFDLELPGSLPSPTNFIYGVINENGGLSTPYSFNQFPATEFFERDYHNNLDSLEDISFSFSIFPKDTIVLLDTDLGLTSSANDAYDIMWKADKGALDCDTCTATTLSVAGYTRVIATATSINGCILKDTAFVKVYIDQDVLIPSAFTPNKDMKNDVLYILGSKDVSQITTFRIYNRWGEKVFERNNFQPNIPEHGWDGKHNGKDAAMAVYVYYFTVDFFNKGKKTYKGTVTLIR